MKPHEFLASVRAKARARANAPKATQTPAVAPPILADDDNIRLDPVWLAEQERIATAARQTNGIDDDSFADAVWKDQADEAWRNPNGDGPSMRIKNIIALGAQSGLSDGQIDALRRLHSRIVAARNVLGDAERHRAPRRSRLYQPSGVNGGLNF